MILLSSSLGQDHSIFVGYSFSEQILNFPVSTSTGSLPLYNSRLRAGSFLSWRGFIFSNARYNPRTRIKVFFKFHFLKSYWPFSNELEVIFIYLLFVLNIQKDNHPIQGD